MSRVFKGKRDSVRYIDTFGKVGALSYFHRTLNRRRDYTFAFHN